MVFQPHSTVLLLVALSVGATTVRAQEATPIARDGYTLTAAQIGEGEIPAFVLSKDASDAKRRPAVILIHGGAVVDSVMKPGLPYKEEWFRPVYEDVPYGLAEKGMLVVAIDAAWAESRVSTDIKPEVMHDTTMMVLTYYIRAVHDVSETIDYLCTRPDVDPKRIGVAGKSGGAITSLMAACQEPRLAAVVSWKGGADFIEMVRLRHQSPGLERSFAKFPDFRKTLEQADPMNNAAKIPPKALAMINNREDPAIPRQTAEVLYEKLQPLYADHPERLMLKLIETKKPSHDDHVEAFDAGRAWLERFLLAPDDASK